MSNHTETLMRPPEQGGSRSPGGLACILSLLILVAPISLSAQSVYTQIEVVPPNPTTVDNVVIRLSGIWADGCVPQSPSVWLDQSSKEVHIETSNPGEVCGAASTPWALVPSVGRLELATYSVIVRYSGPGFSSPVEIARKSFSVSLFSLLEEVILPVVVNGAFAESFYYQTIFTILNPTADSISAELQVYSNTGIPGGVFCSPLAPPPSSIAATLGPGASYLQFTSADLPFHDGWARLRWQGPTTLLASEELTLLATPPAPCLLVCNLPSMEKLSSAQMTAVVPAREFRFPVTLNRYRQTALAIINPSVTDTLNIRISILDAAGHGAELGVAGTFNLKIPPLERVSQFLWQLALEHSPIAVMVPSPESFQGSVILTGDNRFAVGALNIMFPEGKFVSVPGMADP